MLEALRQITGMRFGSDVDRWREWLARTQPRRPPVEKQVSFEPLP